MKKSVILILLFVNLISCNENRKKYLIEKDKIEIINSIINSEKFYNNISEMYRDSIPTIVVNDFITKEIISKVMYHSSRVLHSEQDSTNLIEWKSNWRHPKFYIDFEKIVLKEGKAIVTIRVRSTGIHGKIFLVFKDGNWAILSQNYSET